MANAKRLSRLEQLAAKRTKEKKVCNCRVETSFHSADCLEAILKGASRVCPRHGFREFGFFMFAACWSTLVREDNQFCPCPPHPWRSFLLSGNHTWEGNRAAQEAERKLHEDDDGGFNSKEDCLQSEARFQEDSRRVDAIFAKYREARRQWVKETGRQLPSKEELVKLEWKRAKHANQRP